MKKAFILLFLITLVCLFLGSCEKETVTYCPFCGQASIKEVSVYNPSNGETTLTYKCTNSNCGKSFGAGLVALAVIGGNK